MAKMGFNNFALLCFLLLSIHIQIQPLSVRGIVAYNTAKNLHRLSRGGGSNDGDSDGDTDSDSPAPGPAPAHSGEVGAGFT
ncbi:hypothetical protein CCACVL1_24927, partial [Corchorus capsularis]